MSVRMQKLLVADLFCGAGGFTTGLMRELESLGIEAELVAVNHNPAAIATHSTNHPRARHEIADLNTADPEKLVPEGRLDILLASPTCTFHSRARGGKPTSDQERMDPWVIVTWCTKLRVKRLIIENVPEFVDWGPIDPRTGKPIKSRKGEYFRAWSAALDSIGYNSDWRVLTAADYGDATTRRRFFKLARNDRKDLIWPEATHTRDGVADLFGQKKKWRAAREIIDWTDRGRSIFGRARPHKPNTLRRVRAGSGRLCGPWGEVFKAVIDQEIVRSRMYHEAGVGMRPPKKATKRKKGAKPKAQVPPHPWRFDHEPPTLHFRTVNGRIVRVDEPVIAPPASGDAEPFLVHFRGTGVARDVARPLPGLTAQGTHLGLVQPFVFQVNQSDGRYRSFRSVDQPLFAVLTRDSYGLTDFDVAPFTCANRTNNNARTVDDPIAAATTATGGGIFLVRPGVFLLAQGSNGAPQPADVAPIPTITSISRIQLIEPCISPFVLGQHGGATPRATAEPLPTIACGGAISLIQPYLSVMKKASVSSSVYAPLPAITTRRHLAMIEPYIVAVNHGGGADRRAPHGIDSPLAAITTKRGFGVASAFLTPYYGNALKSGFASSVSVPVPTVTTKGRFALVVPTLDAFLVPNFGERPMQEPRFHLVDLPLPAVTSHGAGGLVEPFVICTRHSLGGGPSPRSCDAPLPTITTGDPALGVATPFIICTRHARLDSGPRPRSVNDPLPTITANSVTGDFGVVSPTPGKGGRIVYVDGHPVLVDVLFRMLRNMELAAAMSFTGEDYTYEFKGTETEITKQIGNAVPVRTARALVSATISDLIKVRTDRTAPAAPKAQVA